MAKGKGFIVCHGMPELADISLSNTRLTGTTSILKTSLPSKVSSCLPVQASHLDLNNAIPGLAAEDVLGLRSSGLKLPSFSGSVLEQSKFLRSSELFRP